MYVCTRKELVTHVPVNDTLHSRAPQPATALRTSNASRAIATNCISSLLKCSVTLHQLPVSRYAGEQTSAINHTFLSFLIGVDG